MMLPFWRDSWRRGFALPVPESSILAEMYRNRDGVLYSADICPHGGTGYPVCYSCSETACGSAFRDKREGATLARGTRAVIWLDWASTQLQNGYAVSISRAVS